jgi:hypothetical protein
LWNVRREASKEIELAGSSSLDILHPNLCERQLLFSHHSICGFWFHFLLFFIIFIIFATIGHNEEEGVLGAWKSRNVLEAH